MLICSKCRFENPPENRFCQLCGASLAAAVEAAESTQNPEEQAIASPPAAPEPAEADPALAAPLELASHPSQGAAALPEADPWLEATAGTPQAAAATAQLPPREAIAGDEPVCLDEPTAWTGDSSDDGLDDDMPTVVLPMQLSRLESTGLTHMGRQREHNEDNFDIYTEVTTAEGPNDRQLAAKGLYILCDGMGGHSSGEVASAMVVQQLKLYFAEHWQGALPDEASIRAAIQTANGAVYEANEQNDSSGSGRMGTTLVLVLIQNTRVAYAHVGDSRLYTYTRRQGLEQRTVDHEVGQLEVMRGVEPEVAYGRPESFQLTQALGPKDNDYINPEIQFFELQEDTLFLLCSDGLSDYQLLEDNAEKVEPLLSSRTSLEQGVSDLVHLANDLSGHDNITAIAIRAKVRPDPRALK